MKNDIDEDNNSIFKGLRVLAVEDNELNAEILGDLMEIRGAFCDIAESGQKALDIFNKSEPGFYKLILMDVQMPIMNGYETTRAFRKLKRKDAGSIPIIAMTANAFENDKKEALASGMNEYVSKPIDFDILEIILKKYMVKNGD